MGCSDSNGGGDMFASMNPMNLADPTMMLVWEAEKDADDTVKGYIAKVLDDLKKESKKDDLVEADVVFEKIQEATDLLTQTK
mmetsp:Transcript_60223/g.51014  ORF Transcript_60223/g.51014 Transcript_60223/m.51014 type:complete len:82 (+) Transcript_60223:45-290(+)